MKKIMMITALLLFPVINGMDQKQNQWTIDIPPFYENCDTNNEILVEIYESCLRSADIQTRDGNWKLNKSEYIFRVLSEKLEQYELLDVLKEDEESRFFLHLRKKDWQLDPDELLKNENIKAILIDRTKIEAEKQNIHESNRRRKATNDQALSLQKSQSHGFDRGILFGVLGTICIDAATRLAYLAWQWQLI